MSQHKDSGPRLQVSAGQELTMVYPLGQLTLPSWHVALTSVLGGSVQAVAQRTFPKSSGRQSLVPPAPAAVVSLAPPAPPDAFAGES
ncbi:MAG TPA: hypothetical protein VFQ61_38860 [Polyangiaceae bacterium]|nr:hypothetical protein [Polyangiaceae bacterium]